MLLSLNYLLFLWILVVYSVITERAHESHMMKQLEECNTQNYSLRGVLWKKCFMKRVKMSNVETIIKTHGSESQGQEKAACACAFKPTTLSNLRKHIKALKFVNAMTKLP